jgi:hypothetical protein
LEDPSIPTAGTAKAGPLIREQPLIREELERMRLEIQASMERSRAQLERVEALLLALQLHEREHEAS